ncbi:MoxR family ATPase [Sorangium sp. So ce448]|uniref:AAA family ATPase n=1 Tax=Sorangium sp. So ce448 TaxID=3133314 RepID=UPI003F61F972
MQNEDKAESPFRTLEARVAKNDKLPPYVYEPHVLRAVKVAGAIGRVLLLRGDPGTGKSTLARNVANALGWDYFESVITSRSQARDLLWTFDQVERLNDAYDSAVDRSNRVREKRNYVEPQALWWAFHPALAAELRPPASPTVPRTGAVVLIDEIDKADPDLPNDLLVPLEAQRFWAEPLGREVVAMRPVFVVVSTNEERDLPQAFLRRAIVVKLERPVDPARLKQIVGKHFAKIPGVFDATVQAYLAAGDRAKSQDLRAPGTAELLDALRACEELHIERSDHPEFELVVEAALWKHGEQQA